MRRAVLLDSGPLGLLSKPAKSPEVLACNQWTSDLIAAGVRVIIPETIDYEIRRELLRANKASGLARLNNLSNVLEYLPLTTAAMRQAAQFWAQARQQGQPTADIKAIDIDVLLAAQAVTCGAANVVVATSNIRHLTLFVAADLWSHILP